MVLHHAKRVLKHGIKKGGMYAGKAGKFIAGKALHQLGSSIARKGLKHGGKLIRRHLFPTSERALTSRGSLTSKARTKKPIKSLHGKGKAFKKVHVSKSLAKKIHKVVDAKDPSGYFQMTVLGNFDHPNVENGQLVNAPVGQSVESVLGEFFNPLQILDAASILWNGKVASTTIFRSDSANFNSENSKIHVDKQWATIKYRNNTQRNVYMNIYACRRKISQEAIGNARSAYIDWSQLMAFEGATGTAPARSGPNVNVEGITTPSTLYATPYLVKGMTRAYDMEMTKVILAPGEEYVYTITGPSKTYDFRKFIMQNTYYPFQKGSVSVFHVMYSDLCGVTGGTGGTVYGRPAETNNAAGLAIPYEINYYYKLRMPEQAGISWSNASTAATNTFQQVPAAGAVTFLGNRRDAYQIVTFKVNLSSGTPVVVRVERENPVPIENPT